MNRAPPQENVGGSDANNLSLSRQYDCDGPFPQSPRRKGSADYWRRWSRSMLRSVSNRSRVIEAGDGALSRFPHGIVERMRVSSHSFFVRATGRVEHARPLPRRSAQSHLATSARRHTGPSPRRRAATSGHAAAPTRRHIGARRHADASPHRAPRHAATPTRHHIGHVATSPHWARRAQPYTGYW